MRKYVLFDLDGTVVDTIDLIVHAFGEVLSRLTGEPWDRERVIAEFGPTEPAILARHAPAGEAEAAFRRFLRLYEWHHDRMVRTFDGVPALIRRLRENGRLLGLVTNKGRETTMVTLRRSGLDGCFGAIVSGDDAGRPKPDPAGLLLALERLGGTPGEAVFVGDAPSDIEAGRRAGTLTCAVTWGRVNATESLLAAGADIVCRTPAELARALGLDPDGKAGPAA